MEANIEQHCLRYARAGKHKFSVGPNRKSLPESESSSPLPEKLPATNATEFRIKNIYIYENRHTSHIELLDQLNNCHKLFYQFHIVTFHLD